MKINLAFFTVVRRLSMRIDALAAEPNPFVAGHWRPSPHSWTGLDHSVSGPFGGWTRGRSVVYESKPIHAFCLPERLSLCALGH